MLSASPLRSSHKISSSTALNSRNHSPTPCSLQNEQSLKHNKRLPIINPLVTLPTWPSKYNRIKKIICSLVNYFHYTLNRCNRIEFNKSSVISECRCSMCSSCAFDGPR